MTQIPPVPTVAGASADVLLRRMQGSVLLPGDPGYDEARRIWNGMIDRRPAVIARCASTADVMAAVAHARDHNQLVSVRGGGHSLPGHSVNDGGIMIDLSPMKRIEVDPQQRTVRAEPGVLWGELDAATQAHGLAVTGGQISHTGIAGLTLGGGLGWLMRKYGLTCDNLAAAEMASGVYVNELEDEGEEGVRAAYGPAYDRLSALKKRYDPSNLFRLNQNIKLAPNSPLG